MNVGLRPSLDLISLCSGGGGLDLGIELAIPCARPRLYVEREGFAIAHLVSAMEAGIMAPAPVWSDARTLNGRRFRGSVDGVIGGIPCQPHSVAGKRLAEEDERDLWPDARRILVQSGAWFFFLENVGGMLSSGGAERVWRDLRRLGFTVEGGLFAAAEVGATHERERLFILAVADAGCERDERWRGRGDLSGTAGEAQGDGHQWQRHGHAFSGGGDDVADTIGDQRSEGRASRDAYNPQGRIDPEQGDRRRTGICGGTTLENADIAVGERAPRPRHDGRDSAAARRERQHAELARSGGDVGDAARGDGTSIGQPQAHHGPPREREHRGSSGTMVDTIDSGRGGRQDGAFWREIERALDEGAGGIPLFPPGPADVAAWQSITERAPYLLPAYARHDRFRIAVGNARALAHGDPAKRAWLDPKGPYGLRAAIVQEIAQSVLRGMADGLAANRVDWLRLLGNGVVNLAAGYAIRTLATRLAQRGSSNATRLVRTMNDDLFS